MLNSVQKIGPVLDLFTRQQPEWRLADIARALDMPKSSTHGLLKTLASIGLLSVEPGGYYRLGWHLLSLSERMRSNADFGSHALPIMKALAEELKETVTLAALDRHRVIYIERAEGMHHAVRVAGARVGSSVPAHCTAVGKVLLAGRDPDEVRSLLQATGMKSLTPRTITDPDEFMEHLNSVRVRGYAYDLGEIVPDIHCTAVPVRDRRHSVVAGLSIATPAYRFEHNKDKVLEKLLAATSVISQRLGTTTPAASDAARPPLSIAH